MSGFVHGSVTYPLTSSVSNSLLQDADPPLFYALDFFSSMITTYVGARLVAQATAVAAPITIPIASTTPFDPIPYLQQEQLQFPLFALWRKREMLTMRGSTWKHNSCVLGAAFVLPPLTPGQAEQLMPILYTIGRVLDNRAHTGSDPGYTPPGGTLGATVWGPTYANLEKIDYVGGEYTFFDKEGTNLVFPCWVGEFRDIVTTNTVVGNY